MSGATHTYAVLEISERAFDEIKEKLSKADYKHAFHEDDERGTVIDMHGIALAKVRTRAEKVKERGLSDGGLYARHIEGKWKWK